MSKRLHFVLRESFGLKVLSAFIVVIVVVLSVFTLFAIVHEREKAKRELRQQGEMLVELLAQSSLLGVFAENEQLLAAAADGIASLNGVITLSIYNANGKPLYVRNGRPAEHGSIPPAAGGIQDRTSVYSVPVTETPTTFEFVRPVLVEPSSPDESLYLGADTRGQAERVIGQVRVVVSKESYRKDILSIMTRNSVIMLIFIFCSIAIVSLAVSKVTRPLERLTDSVKAMGKGIPVEEVPVETRDEIGNLAAAFNAMVVARGQAEQSLRESERKFRMLTETAAAAIFISQDGSLRYLNTTTSTLTGFTREELSRRNFSDIVHEDYRQLLAERQSISARDERSVPPLELKIVTGNGEERWVDYTSGAIEYDGRPAILGTAYDVTERKKLEARFLQAHKMEAVGLLAGGVAHDFNNMLTVITGYGHMLKKKVSGDDSFLIDQILSASERAAHLTHGLLAFSRKQIIQLKPVNANEIIIGIGKLLGRIIGEDIELILDLTGREMTVLADAGQIGQVLMNLATNARDAMPRGGALSIKTEQVNLDGEFIRRHGCGAEGDYALLAVADTGEGILEKTRARIFEPFFTTKEVGKGSGLGLSIVYGIVKQHNGFIFVSSEPGVGTTFRIYLPMVSASAAEIPFGIPEEAPRGTETVLLAEDDAGVRGLAAKLLAESGYTVLEAADGDQAVATFRENRDRIHLLVLDVIMPRKNGNDALEEIRRFRPDVKVLFMSGYAGDIFKKNDIPEQRLNIITKPILPKEFLGKIRDTLDT